jgi:putative toxin-antitoxin system antitoxin component (TIGR02293 family)
MASLFPGLSERLTDGPTERPTGLLSAQETDLLDIASSGAPLSDLERLRALGVTTAEIHALVIPQRTLAHRRARASRLNKDETGRLFRVLQILNTAHAVFGDPDKAWRWLRKPKTQFAGKTPMQMLESELTTELVRELLQRIDHGMAA